MSSPTTLSDRRWWALGVLSITQLMVALDATVINIALPHAQRDLHFSVANRQWLITAYALSFGSLLLIGGQEDPDRASFHQENARRRRSFLKQ